MFAAATGPDWGAIGTIVGGLLAAAAAARAEFSRRAAQKAASPMAMFGELREASQILQEHIDEQIKRWNEDRKNLEKAINTWRGRAESAEAQNLRMHAEMTGVRIDLAATRSDLSELKTRFDNLVRGSQ